MNNVSSAAMITTGSVEYRAIPLSPREPLVRLFMPGCHGLPHSVIRLSWGKNVKIARKGTTTDYKRVINANRFLDKVILKPKQRL